MQFATPTRKAKSNAMAVRKTKKITPELFTPMDDDFTDF